MSKQSVQQTIKRTTALVSVELTEYELQRLLCAHLASYEKDYENTDHALCFVDLGMKLRNAYIQAVGKNAYLAVK